MARIAQPKSEEKSDESEASGEVTGKIEGEDRQEGTRSTVAKIYVWGYLLVIAGALAISTFRKFNINDTKDILLTVSAILSGPLGFIIGYYFKAQHNKD